MWLLVTIPFDLDVLDSFPSKLYMSFAQLAGVWSLLASQLDFLLTTSWFWTIETKLTTPVYSASTSASILSVKWQGKDTQVFLLSCQDFKRFRLCSLVQWWFQGRLLRIFWVSRVHLTVENDSTEDGYWVRLISVVPSSFISSAWPIPHGFYVSKLTTADGLWSHG